MPLPASSYGTKIKMNEIPNKGHVPPPIFFFNYTNAKLSSGTSVNGLWHSNRGATTSKRTPFAFFPPSEISTQQQVEERDTRSRIFWHGDNYARVQQVQ